MENQAALLTRIQALLLEAQGILLLLESEAGQRLDRLALSKLIKGAISCVRSMVDKLLAEISEDLGGNKKVEATESVESVESVEAEPQE